MSGIGGRIVNIPAQVIIHHQFARGAIEIGGGFARSACGSRSRKTLAHNLSNPGHATQFAAQRFLASDVKTAARPKPYCQRTSSGSSVIWRARISSAVGFALEAHVALQRRRSSPCPRRPESRLCFTTFGCIDFFDGGDAGVLLHVVQQDLFQAGWIVQEVRLALRRVARPFRGTRG